MEISKDDWLKKAKELYGDNTEEWVFKCPMCGREQSGKTIREQMKNKVKSKRYGLLKKGDEIFPECACYSPGCNYAANGLFTTGILVIIDINKPHDTNLKRNCLYVFPFSKLDLSKVKK